MELDELYNSMLQRDRLSPNAILPGMRIGVIYDGSIDLITVADVGRGRVKVLRDDEGNVVGHQKNEGLIAVAKISPGRTALKWYEDGSLHLLKLQYVREDWLDDPGILSGYYRAVWEMVEKLPVIPVSKREKHAIWRQTPLEQLVDDNTNGVITPGNRWFYERARS